MRRYHTYIMFTKVSTSIDEKVQYKYDICCAITMEHNVKLYVEDNNCGLVHMFGMKICMKIQRFFQHYYTKCYNPLIN